MRSLDETLHYLASEITKTNFRVVELEGQTLALGTLLGAAMQILGSSGELGALKKAAEASIASVEKYGEGTDESTSRMIKAFVDKTNSILLSADQSEPQSAFEIIQGGKSED